MPSLHVCTCDCMYVCVVTFLIKLYMAFMISSLYLQRMFMAVKTCLLKIKFVLIFKHNMAAIADYSKLTDMF